MCSFCQIFHYSELPKHPSVCKIFSTSTHFSMDHHIPTFRSLLKLQLLFDSRVRLVPSVIYPHGTVHFPFSHLCSCNGGAVSPLGYRLCGQGDNICFLCHTASLMTSIRPGSYPVCGKYLRSIAKRTTSVSP